MKTKSLFLALIAVIAINTLVAQTLPFTFIKACTTFDRAAFTEDMTKKKFYVVEESSKKSTNPMMDGATFYCNEKERELGNAEIDVVSSVKGDKKITEITFIKGNKHDYAKNFGEIYNQMNSMFNKTAPIQSKRYKTEVTTFTKNGIFYYTFKVNELPVIVISSYKIDTEFF
ncbi:MAG: hypothetical protein IPP64_12040 [Bacteroidetes bacterium]|nr:hypothetical protein [Bacteroidota bacterium]